MPVTAEPARKIIYRAAEGAGFTDAAATKYGRFLARKVGLGKRVVSPEEIVDAARPERSPIHDRFTWNDTLAAERWRLSEARHLVRHLVVVETLPDGELTEVRAFLSVSQANGDRGYLSETVVWRDSRLAEQVVTRALDELRGWRDRYRAYAQLAGITAQIDEILDEEAGE